jgi:hypothetical protein
MGRVLANVDDTVVADRIDGQEGVLILYTLLIVVAGTVARTYLISFYIMFHRRSCIRVQP